MFWEGESEEFILIPLKLFSYWKLLDLDGLSQLSYQDILSCHGNDHISVDSRTRECRSAGQHSGPRMESSTADGFSQQAAEGCLELEAAFTNQGFEGNDATDSSSAWSPEVQWTVIYYMWCKILNGTGGFYNLDSIWKAGGNWWGVWDLTKWPSLWSPLILGIFPR